MRKIFGFTCLLLIVAVGCDAGNARPGKRPNTSTSTPATEENAENTRTSPDNSATNERDSDGNTKTPFDQSESAEDRELTAKIRQQVVDLPDASINAQNIKIITAGGKVTLRGPVANQAERNAIEAIAKKEAGDANVDSQLEVASE